MQRSSEGAGRRLQPQVGLDDEDDFRDESAKKRPRRNGEEGQLPQGQSAQQQVCLLADKWRGGRLADAMAQDGWSVQFQSLRCCDFLTAKGHAVVYLSEADYAGTAAASAASFSTADARTQGSPSRAWKRRLAKLATACRPGAKGGGEGGDAGGGIQCRHPVLVCQRTPPAGEDFLAVQEFAVADLGMPLIPINDQMQLLQILAQLSANRKSNPFKYGSRRSSSSGPLLNKQLCESLCTLPGVGNKSAQALLKEFKFIQRIFTADEKSLAKVIGSSMARDLYKHLHYECGS